MQRADPLNSVKKHGSGSALYQPPVGLRLCRISPCAV